MMHLNATYFSFFYFLNAFKWNNVLQVLVIFKVYQFLAFYFSFVFYTVLLSFFFPLAHVNV